MERNKKKFSFFLKNIIEKISVKAFARFIRMSPFKVRRIADLLRGCSFGDSLMILSFMPYRSCIPVFKVFSNAQQRFGVPKSSLFVGEIRVDAGPVLKRFQPRAQGRGFRTRKPTCHISITLEAK